jgi:3-dehydroquinate dehydratase type I
MLKPAPYCLPIIKSDPAEILEIIRDNLADYHYFEVWLDYIDQPEDAFLRQLVDLLGERLIVLFRRQNLEPPSMDSQQRQSILNMLSNTPVLVDLDINQQRAELGYIKEQNVAINLITSYHDYQQTPAAVQLEAIIGTMKPYQPVLYKLSTLCNEPRDGLRLSRLLLKLKAEGLTVIVSGMGEYGQVTKIFGSSWGNAMTFAPLKPSEQSAPGQLTRDQLEIIFKQLES